MIDADKDGQMAYGEGRFIRIEVLEEHLNTMQPPA